MGECKEDVLSMVSYLHHELVKADVNIRLGTTATKAVVEALSPDVVIVAVGGSHVVPQVPGIDSPNVLTSEALFGGLKSYLDQSGNKVMKDIDPGYVPVGRSVVIIGGDFQGTQIAEFLIKRGRKVSIVEAGPQIGAHLLHHLVRPQVYDWLFRKGVRMETEAILEAITEKGVVFLDKEGERQTIEADTVITALQFRSNEALSSQLQGIASQIHCIGDAREPGKIIDAIADGARIGREV